MLLASTRAEVAEKKGEGGGESSRSQMKPDTFHERGWGSSRICNSGWATVRDMWGPKNRRGRVSRCNVVGFFIESGWGGLPLGWRILRRRDE
eukprot:767548-Hanusia_phi.AAC.11